MAKFVVEKVLGERVNNKNNKEYFLKWEGYSDDYNSWEEEKNLNCPDLIKEYKKSLQNQFNLLVKCKDQYIKRKPAEFKNKSDPSISNPGTKGILIKRSSLKNNQKSGEISMKCNKEGSSFNQKKSMKKMGVIKKEKKRIRFAEDVEVKKEISSYNNSMGMIIAEEEKKFHIVIKECKEPDIKIKGKVSNNNNSMDMIAPIADDEKKFHIVIKECKEPDMKIKSEVSNNNNSVDMIAPIAEDEKKFHIVIKDCKELDIKMKGEVSNAMDSMDMFDPIKTLVEEYKYDSEKKKSLEVLMPHDPNLVAQHIVGVVNFNGEMMFLIKYEEWEEGKLILPMVANIRYPQIVIKFYEGLFSQEHRLLQQIKVEDKELWERTKICPK